MKRLITISLVAGVMGIVGLSGPACSMEKLDDSASKTNVGKEVADPIIKAIEANSELKTDEAATTVSMPNEVIIDAISVPSEELVRLSWEASHKRDLERLDQLVSQCVQEHGAKAKILQAGLTAFPTVGQKKQFQELNNVGTCLFIKAEAVMNSGDSKEAKIQFEYIIEEYPWAQAWDPRGWLWSVAEKSQASIDVLTGKAEEDFVQQTEPIELIRPKLFKKGQVNIVDYTKYGKFENVGNEKYFYRMHDPDGLSDAIGEGIYPNSGAIYDNP